MAAKRRTSGRFRTQAVRTLIILPFVLATIAVSAWLAFRSTELGGRLEAAAIERIAARLEPKVYRIRIDGGGVLGEYIDRYNHLRASGARVVIDGLCISACTMVVGLIPENRVCATPFGQLAFHSASATSRMGRQHSSEGTRLLWAIYPQKVRDLLIAKNWDGDDETKNEHPNLIYVAGDELHTIVRPCGAGELN